MLNDKTIKQMNKVEMVRCEVTGKLYPANECEVVVIKIIKWKDADINNYNTFTSTVKTKEVDINRVLTDTPEDKSVVVPPPAFNSKMMQKQLSVVPKAMRDVFSKPPELL